jgi:U4/U6 small nuclear ribonucleoprotein PRP3
MDPKITMPQVMEWWDVELLPSKLKKQVASQEGKALSKHTKAQLQQLKNDADDDDDESKPEAKTNDAELQKQCFEQASLSYSKTAELVQHIVPVKTGPTGPPPQPTLYLTKKERKRQRKLRREERQRELQDMQAAGLIPPPEPRLTLRNFIQVLGDQAFLDPSQMEQKVVEQMQARQRAHMERNEANRLSKEQRSEKRKKKLSEDTSQGVTVALFWVKDMSHPYHRTKVDLNAQQNNLTGGVLECEHPSLACVIVEGGPKAIKRYTRLMTVRMKWTGTDDAGSEDEEEDDDGEAVTHKVRVLAKGHLFRAWLFANFAPAALHIYSQFNPDNKCELVWTGMGAKRLFKGFIFQSCETSDVARKVLAAKGVGHFWDQVLSVASGKGESFNLKLAADEDTMTLT